jgi:aminoglycoside/choline kinase family phosphotransferase
MSESKHSISAFKQWIAQQLQVPVATIDLQAASADASFRHYYRLQLPDRSMIAMDASAERASCVPFVNIARLLAHGHVHVPQILAENLEQGWLLLGDLGRQTYLDVLDDDNADRLFSDAIDALIAVQKIPAPANFPQYDAALLRRELELFPEWYLQRHLGISIDATLRAELDALFDLLIERVLRQSQVLVHRDFMPRNLMLSEPNPGVLDFQDAVYGPIAYDPICLFKDAFISWPEARVESWLRDYWQRARAANLSMPATFADFYADCDFIGVQRHLKVIGIFARICHRDGKPKYVSDVPRFFEYLRGACTRRGELASLAELIERFAPQ